MYHPRCVIPRARTRAEGSRIESVRLRHLNYSSDLESENESALDRSVWQRLHALGSRRPLRRRRVMTILFVIVGPLTRTEEKRTPRWLPWSIHMGRRRAHLSAT